MTELELIEKLTEALSANDQKLDNLIQAHNEKVESKKKEPDEPKLPEEIDMDQIMRSLEI